jgi:cell division protein FtsI (penicillin-binding protein 3)
MLPDLRKKQVNNMVKMRLYFIGCCFVFGFAVVAVKASEVMLFNDNWKRSGNYKQIKSSNRMEIVDRNGVILATNLKTRSAYANPHDMMETKDAARKLAKALPQLKEADLLKAFNRKASFVWIKRNLIPEEQKAINDLGIPGIYFTDDVARVYPQGPALSHILGYVNVDNQGLAGVEREFDELLSMGSNEPLQLSVDVKLQHILRDELETQFRDYKALGAAGAIVDVHTGEVLAMASLPDFDPNSPGTATPDSKFNRLTLGTYEMGSTFKAFTLAAALDSGAVTMNSTFDATQPIRIGHQTIHDYHGKKRVLTLTEVLMYSSNIGTAKMAMELGADKFKTFLGELGMFDYTDIEIPEKAKPLIPKRWPDVTLMTVSFGHGIAITPIHMAQGYATMLNGGYKIPLTLTKKPYGAKVEGKRIISEETSKNVRQILRDIVLGGTGKNADAEGYQVGGKTGTAEKLVHGRYEGSKVMSSFMGGFPMNDPRYAVVVIIDEPQEKQKYVRPTGGIVAAPAVKNIIMRAGTLLGIKPQFDKNANNEASDYAKAIRSGQD